MLPMCTQGDSREVLSRSICGIHTMPRSARAADPPAVQCSARRAAHMYETQRSPHSRRAAHLGPVVLKQRQALRDEALELRDGASHPRLPLHT